MCFRGFGKSSWRRRKRFLFKVWSPSPSSSSGSELRSTAKNNPPRTASTRSRNAEKNTSVSPTGATPPPTSGLFIQSVVVVGFQEEKSGKGKRRGRRGRGQPNVEVEEEGTERHIFSTLNCHAIRRFVLVPFAPGGSPAANASAGGVARNSDKARKQRATCRTTECRRHVVSQLFRRIGVVIVQLSTPVLLPVARAELQIESFANMSAFSGNTAVLPIAKTAQLALVFVKEKNKGRVF